MAVSRSKRPLASTASCARGADLGEHGLDAAAVLGERGAADLHLHDGVAAVEVGAHLGAQRGVVLAGMVVAAGGVDEHAGVGRAAVARGEQVVQGLAGDLGGGVPDGHVQRADGDGALAVAAGLLVAHQGGPDAVGVEVVPGVVEEGGGVGFEQARGEAFADQAALAVAAVGVEAVADDGAAVAHHVGDDGDQAGRHLGEVDVGVADRGGDRLGGLADVGDSHGRLRGGREARGPGQAARSAGAPSSPAGCGSPRRGSPRSRRSR